jgi:hypothetical protein
MKKITLLMLLAASIGLLQAQTSPDYIFGSDNGAGWNWTTGTQGTASLGNSYKWQFAATATDNHYFKFGETASNADGSGFWVNSSGPDMNYTGGGAKWTAYYKSNMADGGAIYTAITSGNYYVVKARKQAGNDIDFAVFDNGAAAPVTISSVTRTISSNDLTVTATASAAAGTNEKIWLRYSKDNWTTSTTTEMTFTSGTSYAATLNCTSGDFVSYYVLTTINQTSAPAETDVDFYTVNYNNNSGKNYTVQIGPFSGNYYIPQGTNAKGFDLLSTAINNINTTGVGGDVILYITDNITEPANIGLGVNTNGHSITIRPDQDADRTITFTKLSDNTSPTGHFIIGYVGEGLTSAWSDANTIATSNVTIDGFAEGGSTRRLTFTNTNASHTNARVIVVVGACENTVIKNCIINNLTTHTGSPFCVGAVVRKGTAIEVAPKNLTIENNIMTALGNNVAMGMRITNSGTLTTGYPVVLTGLVIKNNIITAKRRLIEINYTSGGDIYNNEFKTQATGAAGTVSYGLWTSTGVTGTINIYNNKFTQAFTEETGAFGHRVISLASGATYNVYNNMFAGLDKTKPSTVALNLVYLFYSGVSGKIYNNTFYMPKLTDASSTGYYNAIQISGNTAEIKNNIFISDEDTHSNTAFISAVPTPASDYNNFYLRHSHSGSKIVSTYTTLADYQAANPTKDVHSKSKDVNFVSATDLSLTGTSIDDMDLAAPAIGSPVTTDIFGNDRHTPNIYMGAHEPTNLNDTQNFTVTVPNGTEHVYIAGSFIGKFWDINNPFELTATANANEFSGTFPAHSNVEYKYLCETGDWDYQEAVYEEGIPVQRTTNRTYVANDIVPIWYRVKSVTLNVSFEASVGVPNQLFLMSSINDWKEAIELTKQDGTFTTTLTNDTQKVPANTEYKYFTNEPFGQNWECNLDMTPSSNRWTIAPVMNDEIQRFTTRLVTETEVPALPPRLMRTPTGIRVELNEPAAIELYNINGSLIEKTKATGTYTRDLNNGIYIIRINGKSTKFVK